MAHLVANPGRYDGTTISVTGVLSCEDQSTMMFADEFAYRSFDITRLIRLPSMSENVKQECENRVEGEAVTIRGEFEAPPPRASHDFIGSFRWVSYIRFNGFSYNADWMN